MQTNSHACPPLEGITDTNTRRTTAIVALLATAFAVDIALKVFARVQPETVGRFSFLTPVGTIGLAPSVNDVLAFSLPVPNAWIWPVGWIVVLVLIRALGRISDFRFQISDSRAVAIAAIVLGAISNLTDRTFLGGVTDYLSFTNLFPAFNIADVLILGGIIAWMMSERRRTAA